MLCCIGSAQANPLAYYPALMDTLLAGCYPAADSIVGIIRSEVPGHPAALYAEAAVLYSAMIDLEDTLGRSRFMELTEQCIRDTKRRIKAGDGSPEILHYLRGSALSSRGIILHREGRTLSAVRLLMRSRDEFSRAIEYDPAFYDAYLGRGAYRFMAARHASLIHWLGVVPSRESGLRDIRLAADSSRFSRYSALSALVWFCIEDGDLAEAERIYLTGLNRFPDCRAFLWPKLAVEKRRGDWANAERTALNLLNQYLTLPASNGYDVTNLYVNLVEIADAMNDPARAVRYAQAGIDAPRTEYAEARSQDKLERLKQRLTQDAGKE